MEPKMEVSLRRSAKRSERWKRARCNASALQRVEPLPTTIVHPPCSILVLAPATRHARRAGRSRALARRACWPSARAPSRACHRSRTSVTLLSTRALRGIVEYEPEEFTFTALAGTPVREIGQVLAEKGQYLPFDPMWLEAGATLGGTVCGGRQRAGSFPLRRRARLHPGRAVRGRPGTTAAHGRQGREELRRVRPAQVLRRQPRALSACWPRSPSRSFPLPPRA